MNTEIIITNESELLEIVSEKDVIRYKEKLRENFDYHNIEEEYQIEAGEGYSQDRVFLFEFVCGNIHEIKFEYAGTCKG